MTALRPVPPLIPLHCGQVRVIGRLEDGDERTVLATWGGASWDVHGEMRGKPDDWVSDGREFQELVVGIAAQVFRDVRRAFGVRTVELLLIGAEHAVRVTSGLLEVGGFAEDGSMVFSPVEFSAAFTEAPLVMLLCGERPELLQQLAA